MVEDSGSRGEAAARWLRPTRSKNSKEKLLEIALEATESGTKKSSTMKIAVPKRTKRGQTASLYDREEHLKRQKSTKYSKGDCRVCLEAAGSVHSLHKTNHSSVRHLPVSSSDLPSRVCIMMMEYFCLEEYPQSYKPSTGSSPCRQASVE